METVCHKNLTGGRWAELSFAEQMGNVGSEVGRAISWQKRGQEQLKEQALIRAFELLDLTVCDRRWRGKLKELLRAREALADFFYGDNIYRSSPEFLERYFYHFARAARKNR